MKYWKQLISLNELPRGYRICDIIGRCIKPFRPPTFSSFHRLWWKPKQSHKRVQCEVSQRLLTAGRPREIFIQRNSIVLATSGSENGSQERLGSAGVFLLCLCGAVAFAMQLVFSRCISWPRRELSLKRQYAIVHGSCFFREIFPPAPKTCCCLPNSPYLPFMSD